MSVCTDRAICPCGEIVFAPESSMTENEGFSPADTDEYVTTRILALIEYLSTMQVK